MIYGKDNSLKENSRQLKILEKIKGVRKFAWLPQNLHDGRTVWLCHYWAYYEGGYKKGSYFLWSSSPEDYSPYYAAYLERNSKHISLSGIKDV